MLRMRIVCAVATTALALIGATTTTAAAASATTTTASTASRATVTSVRPAAAANPTSGYWTGTWATAPQSGGDTFSGQTIRQVVHTSISGTATRLQLSNAFGSSALTVSDVHVAEAGSGSSIVSGTDHVVTFGGSGSVSIAAGGTGISDSIAFAVPALTNIAISFFLPNNTGPSTYHQFSMANSFIASGDVSGAAGLSNAQTENSYFFLSSLDVQNANSQGSVVALGASITDGYVSTVDGNDRWTDVLASRLNSAGDTIGVLNEGISGNRLLVDGAGQSALNRFARDVLGQPGVRWVIFSDDPINDLGSTSPQPTSAQLISGIQQLITAAHQNGIKFICSTLTPYQGAGYWNQSGETARDAIDTWIRSGSSGCDGVIDQDTATHDPSNPTWYLSAYDSGDHLHPNDAGYQAIGNAVNLGLFTPPNVPVISLRAHANGDIVTADNGGGSALIANRTSVGIWEQFDEISQGTGYIALRAHANGLIVTAENAGAQPLIANRTAVGAWETFQLVQNSDGSVSLKADANGDYVTAENAGAQSLIANRTAIGAWEEFDLIQDS
ncbi:GDSL-type esterase/lipase family protein [Actinospica sp.]|uniref:GDSL-type esterase/lipase family protein n=1 Tax=Actinospica sp. TaxID=1872142 RepID=UPI002B67FD7F|nr:GDSL-type esterase/lipase family protein [Actinospica sp.]HWG24657.1 GDSL-type esterase/lipase family protein [Actinospica sp.]